MTGAAILCILAQQLGTEGFVRALTGLDATTLLTGTIIAGVTTACSAWRWRTVARQLRVEVPWSFAVAACYRAQFWNVSLPGGVLGDIDRGLRHGRAVHDLARGVRAVVWERTLGLLVLVVAAGGALIAARPFEPVRMLVVAGITTALPAGLFAVACRSRAVAEDARVLLHPAVLVTVVVSSLAALTGYILTLALAAHAVGVRMPPTDFVPVALFVLLVAAVPVNFAGWGPREGAAVWAFGTAGSTGDEGLAVAVAFGVIVAAGTVPGAVLVLLGDGRRPNLRLSGSPTGTVRRGGGARE
ncbi:MULTISPECIES: lysylphosphatidylglycerol synthase transmembrane domain-containing protein [unclassified Knoellia]|uniref:lysylphosphatidylglycerol synthase transmembrane domain-containing protein n=1 Tax=Knoellia altitudinis TaxID=3404795 RepID=UPI00361A3489